MLYFDVNYQKNMVYINIDTEMEMIFMFNWLKQLFGKPLQPCLIKVEVYNRKNKRYYSKY